MATTPESPHVRSLPCRDCPGFDEVECARRPHSLRRCVNTINQYHYAKLIGAGQRILEVGCGVRSPIREHCLSVGATWEGVDIAAEHLGRKTIATRLESVENLSWPDGCFDCVIGNQTLEHWNENGCRIVLGLYQVFRVTKPGGRVFLNVPIHLHGSSDFVWGRLGSIVDSINPFAAHIEILAFRKEHQPLPAATMMGRYPPLSGSSAYVLDLRCIRKPSIQHPKDAGFLIRQRWFRELRDHSVGYLLFKLLRKIRIRLGLQQ